MVPYDSGQHLEVVSRAKQAFDEGRYTIAEPILNQLILKNVKKPEIFHMLASIYYDQGKFNKAIRTFKRALEMDPTFTDASVGLSIIYNDLGRYEEGQAVFSAAKSILEKDPVKTDPYVNEKLSVKHDELGALYFQYRRHKEALDQFFKALSLSTRKPEITLKIVECYLQLNNSSDAIKHLESLCKSYPKFHSARLKLGKVYYDLGRVPEACEQWEKVLRLDPRNVAAHDYLKLAQSVEMTHHDKDSGLSLF